MTTIESGAASRIAFVLAKLRASAISQATESEMSREMKTNRVGGRSESRSVLPRTSIVTRRPSTWFIRARKLTAPSFSNAVVNASRTISRSSAFTQFGRLFRPMRSSADTPWRLCVPGLASRIVRSRSMTMIESMAASRIARVVSRLSAKLRLGGD